MKQDFQTILLITKAGNIEAQAEAASIQVWLEEKGLSAHIRENSEDSSSCGLEEVGPDLIVILGGDGTMLSVARKIGQRGIPLLGINIGTVGFLTELSLENWKQGLTPVLRGTYFLSKRPMLKYSIQRQGEKKEEGIAVNDVVLCRGKMARLVKLEVTYNDEFIGTIRADGLIVSTATGATAYSVSAGGSLIHPDLDVLTLTPVCPFLSGFNPLVLPGSGQLKVAAKDSNAEYYLTQDGQAGFPISPGDVVFIERQDDGLTLLKPNGEGYFHKLRAKGFIKES